jgi:uncharacterized protein with PhoU and TrkA domain
MSPRRKIALADEESVRQIALIIGPCSAADRALAELDMRRNAGEDVVIYQTPSGWVVGPPGLCN